MGGNEKRRFTIGGMHTIAEHDRALTRLMIEHLQDEEGMENNPENYQRKMDAEYFAANFKKEHWPADPFESGILTDASYLDIPDLAAIFKAGKALCEEGNEAFYHGLILFEQSQDEKWKQKVRVNPLYLDAKFQRTVEISELLSDFYFGNCDDFAQKWNEILDMNDPQLVEMLRQVEEILGLTPREMKVIEVIDED